MPNYLTFFPVGNGDMTLIVTKENVNVLLDCNMKKSAEDKSTNDYDCNEYLHNNLPDDNGMPYLDAMFLTHSDQDHCRGIKEYFNLCDPNSADSEKILIKELFVPARLLIDDEHRNDDADAIRNEAKRRLNLYGKDKFKEEGNRLQIIGYSNELSDYSEIIVPAGSSVENVNNIREYGADIFVLRPVKKDTDNEDASVNDCTASFKITFTESQNEYVVIIGGDLVCDNWKEVIEYNPDLEFDVLLAPHHCSWLAISSDQDVHKGEPDVEIIKFLEESKRKAFIVSSSKPIKRNDDNPPSYRAMNVYKSHIEDENRFVCTSEYPKESDPKPYTLKITGQGVSVKPLEIASNINKNNVYTPKSYGFGGSNE